MNTIQGKAPVVDRQVQRSQETEFEAQCRKAADFARYESLLPSHLTRPDISIMNRSSITDMVSSWLWRPLAGLLGSYNPFVRDARASQHLAWILDNTAYKPQNSANGSNEWEAEYVACFFHNGRQDVTKFVSAIADAIGVDGAVGMDEETRQLIATRVQPFIHAIAPAKTLPVSVPLDKRAPLKVVLGPSDANGISSQIVKLGSDASMDGRTVISTTDPDAADAPLAQCNTRFAGPEGWAIISDVDDTIKITQTPNPAGILRNTFAEPAEAVKSMPELYKTIDEQFGRPAWFYLSASPYNLYPFLHQFIQENYQKGTLILRDSSWMAVGGLLSALTQGTQAYKTDRINKIHGWLPKRKFICIGDSTQTDPESYAEMHQRYPEWIKAIYIRKATDAPFMDEKNTDQRFTKAFKDVPSDVWKVFTEPEELKDHLTQVAEKGEQSTAS